MSSSNGTKCYVNHEVNGRIFESGNLDLLFLKWISHLIKKSLRMHQNIIETRPKEFSPDNFMHYFEKIYHD